MNKIAGLRSLALLISCTHPPKSPKSGSNNQHKTGHVAEQSAKDTTAQLVAFMDSIGRLSQQALENKADFEPDSAFRSQRQLDTLLSEADFDIVK